MDPLLLSLLVGTAVIGMVLAVAFALAGRQDDLKVGERLDLLVGRRAAKDSSADMLLKQALSEVDKKNLLDKLTPEAFNLTKVIAQADANVKPSALFGAGVSWPRSGSWPA